MPLYLIYEGHNYIISLSLPGDTFPGKRNNDAISAAPPPSITDGFPLCKCICWLFKWKGFLTRFLKLSMQKFLNGCRSTSGFPGCFTSNPQAYIHLAH